MEIIRKKIKDKKYYFFKEITVERNNIKKMYILIKMNIFSSMNGEER